MFKPVKFDSNPSMYVRGKKKVMLQQFKSGLLVVGGEINH